MLQVTFLTVNTQLVVFRSNFLEWWSTALLSHVCWGRLWWNQRLSGGIWTAFSHPQSNLQVLLYSLQCCAGNQKDVLICRKTTPQPITANTRKLATVALTVHRCDYYQSDWQDNRRNETCLNSTHFRISMQFIASKNSIPSLQNPQLWLNLHIFIIYCMIFTIWVQLGSHDTTKKKNPREFVAEV